MRLGVKCVAVSAGIALWVCATAQIAIYHPGGGGSSAFSFSSWGNGTIAETTDVSKDGGGSIKVMTRGLYQGGILGLKNPVDLKAAAADPNNLLTMQVLIPDNSSGSSSDTALFPKQIRIVLAFDDGKMAEVYFTTYRFYHAQSRWHAYAIPVSKIPKFAESSQKLTAIGFYADIPTTLYIAQIDVLSDNTPITGEIYSPYTNIGREDEIPFGAIANAGDTALKYYWDWNAEDGLQHDSEGPYVWHRFRIPGTYTVTLILEDAYGVKKPFTTTVKITVNP